MDMSVPESASHIVVELGDNLSYALYIGSVARYVGDALGPVVALPDEFEGGAEGDVGLFGSSWVSGRVERVGFTTVLSTAWKANEQANLPHWRVRATKSGLQRVDNRRDLNVTQTVAIINKLKKCSRIGPICRWNGSLMNFLTSHKTTITSMYTHGWVDGTARKGMAGYLSGGKPKKNDWMVGHDTSGCKQRPGYLPSDTRLYELLVTLLGI